MNSAISDTKTLLQDTAEKMYDKMVDVFPSALVAIAIVIIGWIIATIVYSLCRKLLQFFAIDKLVAKTPLEKAMRSLGIKKSASKILCLLFFWMTMLITFVFAAEILSLHQVSNTLGVITRYIPQIIAAFLIIIFGMLLGRFLEALSVQFLSRTEVGYEKSVGKIVQIIVLLFVFLAAIEQLGFDLSFVTTNVLLFFASIFLIVGAGLVVVSRCILENYLALQQIKQQISIGQNIIIGDVEGRVQEFTSVGIVIENEKGKTTVPCAQLLKTNYTLTS